MLSFQILLLFLSFKFLKSQATNETVQVNNTVPDNWKYAFGFNIGAQIFIVNGDRLLTTDQFNGQMTGPLTFTCPWLSGPTRFIHAITLKFCCFDDGINVSEYVNTVFLNVNI